MLLFAAVLASLIPEARADASMRPLHRCEAVLDTPSGERIMIPAWGMSPELAMEQAHRVGRFFASQDLAADVFPGLLVEGPESQELLLTRVGHTLGDSMVGVPGYLLEDGVCRAEVSGQTRKDHSWVVRWTAGDPVSVARADAASAIETARRRACIPSYQGTLELVLRDISHAVMGERDGIARGGYVGAVESLKVCLTRAQPDLRAGLEKARPILGVPIECAASSMSMEGVWRTSVAWGDEAEWTAETAQWELSSQLARRGISEALDAAVHASPDDRLMHISSGAARLTRLVARSLALERAGISCSTLRADSGQELVWRPVDVGVAEHCGPLQSWSGRRVLLEPGTAWTELRYRSCQQLVHQGLTDAEEALEKASEDRIVALTMSLWEELVGCAARCSGDIERTASSGESPLRLEGQIDLWESPQVQIRLQEAIANRDAEEFEICVPGLAIFRAVMVAQPDRFWGDWAAMERSGQLYQSFGWEEYRGRWYLMPRG